MNLRLRFQVLVRDGHTCEYCGAQAPDVALEVDHIVPRSAGGDDSLSNLVTACRECNQGKKAHLLEPLEGPSNGGDWDDWEARLHDKMWSWFRNALEQLDLDWFTWTGESITIHEKYATGELLVTNNYRRLRQAMRISAVRHGYEPEVINPETLVVVTTADYGRVDLREVKRTLERWRREQAWRHGE